jgi:hypothetical protein
MPCCDQKFAEKTRIKTGTKMKTQKWLILVVALVLMVGTAAVLTWLRANQRLGKPGLKATPIPGSTRVNIDLPERVLDFTSTNLPETKEVLGYLPQDTSYAGRYYTAPDGFHIQSSAILMGADRTSIHRPEYCIPGHGWTIGEKKIVDIPIQDDPPYQLEVARWNLSVSFKQSNGQMETDAGIYVFWYVTDNEQTANHDKMLEWLTLDLFRTGALQRWAYILDFASCQPGQEDATFERMKDFIAAQVPQFQLPIRRK